MSKISRAIAADMAEHERSTAAANRGAKRIANHTPGPWEIGVHENAVYVGETNIAVCDGASQSWPDYATVKANARLIASAPTLKAERDELRAMLARLLDAHALPQDLRRVPDKVIEAHDAADAMLERIKP